MNGLRDALVDMLLRAVQQGRPRLRVVAEWIAEVARPPRGVRLVSVSKLDMTQRYAHATADDLRAAIDKLGD